MIESDEQKLQVRRIFRNGRRRYDPASKARLVAGCLEPGVSVSRVALDNGINANLLRKWIKEARETSTLPSSPASKFIPVVAVDHGLPMQGMQSATSDGAPLSTSERTGPRFSSAKVNASLPNGVNLTLECGDMNALMAMIGALGHVPPQR